MGIQSDPGPKMKQWSEPSVSVKHQRLVASAFGPSVRDSKNVEDGSILVPHATPPPTKVAAIANDTKLDTKPRFINAPFSIIANAGRLRVSRDNLQCAPRSQEVIQGNHVNPPSAQNCGNRPTFLRQRCSRLQAGRRVQPVAC